MPYRSNGFWLRTDLTASADPNVNGILEGYYWNVDSTQGHNVITYSFPNSSADYGTGYGTGAGQYPWQDPFQGFSALNAAQQQDVKRAFDLISSYTPLTFQQVPETSVYHAAIRLADSSSSGRSQTYFPDKGSGGLSPDPNSSGDVFFASGINSALNPAVGNFASGRAILHEIGHALGLAHGEQDPNSPSNPFGWIGAQFDDIEYSVMNYRSYIGQPATEVANGATEGDASSPQSYMMYDIAALQYLYGANFNNRGLNQTYTWDPASGTEIISTSGPGFSGYAQLATPVVGTFEGTFRIFETVWTGGSNSTFDLSKFNDDAYLDMRPGQYLKFSTSHLADLGWYSSSAGGSGAKLAQGNVYNALLYHGDTSSEIHNIITGNGNDTVIGNDLYNTITLGSGNDKVYLGAAGGHVLMGTHSDSLYWGGNTSVHLGMVDVNTIIDYSRVAEKITINAGAHWAEKSGAFGPLGTDTWTTEVDHFIGGATDTTFVSAAGKNFWFTGSGGTNTLDYSWDTSAIEVNLGYQVVNKLQSSGRLDSSDMFSNIQVFDGGRGGATFDGLRTGSYTFNGDAYANNTLKYIKAPGAGSDHADVANPALDGGGFVFDLRADSVWKGPGVLDHFSNIEHFIVGGNGNSFLGGAGSYSLDGGGTGNWLNYYYETGSLTINVHFHTAWKADGTDTFQNIQNFEGDMLGPTTFVSDAGSYSFVSFNGNGRLEYTGLNAAVDITVDNGNGQVLKGNNEGTDSFTNIHTFVGGSAFGDAFRSGAGSYTFIGGSGNGTTLIYSGDASPVTIDLQHGTVTKATGTDHFSNIQYFYGTSGADTVIAGPGSHFFGGNGLETVIFHGARSEYSITTLSGHGIHTTVTDQGAAGDGTLDMIGVGELKFTDVTAFGGSQANGTFTISGSQQIELLGASSGHMTFAAASSGTLMLDHAANFTGQIAGFSGKDQIDLGDIGFGTSTKLAFAANTQHTGGTLTVSDGTHTATLALQGSFTSSSFADVSDGHGGTLIDAAQAPLAHAPVVMPSGNSVIGSSATGFWDQAAVASGHGSTLTNQLSAGNAALSGTASVLSALPSVNDTHVGDQGHAALDTTLLDHGLTSSAIVVASPVHSDLAAVFASLAATAPHAEFATQMHL